MQDMKFNTGDRSKIGNTLVHMGEAWRVIGVGTERNGSTFCHLINLYRKVKREYVQINDWVDSAVLANSKNPKQARDAEHSDLDNLSIHEIDICADIDCYFDAETGNLWHAYVGDHDIFNVMRDSSIEYLEQQYAKHCRQQREQDAIDRAAERYEARQLDVAMGV